MASRKLMDPNFIPCFTETCEKEKWLRMHWVNRHSDSLQRAATLNREPTNYTRSDIKEGIICAGMPALTRDNVVAAGNRRTAHVNDIHVVKLGKPKELDPAMMSVSKEMKEVFYTEPRVEYLRRRHLVPPDKKYNYVECTSWKHGWHFDQSAIKLQGPVHGKKNHMLSTRGLGPQPDPPHYRDCKDISGLCTDMS